MFLRHMPLLGSTRGIRLLHHAGGMRQYGHREEDTLFDLTASFASWLNEASSSCSSTKQAVKGFGARCTDLSF